MSATAPWKAHDPAHAQQAKEELSVWPLDESNAALLNEVHPRGYTSSVETPHEEYDLIAIGSGAGGLVSSKQVRVLCCVVLCWFVRALLLLLLPAGLVYSTLSNMYRFPPRLWNVTNSLSLTPTYILTHTRTLAPSVGCDSRPDEAPRVP
jgi:hypothetical protein